MKHFLLLILSGIVTGATYSQNLTGTWLGKGNYKIVIVHINDSCYGYTYDTGMGYCKANFIGTYNDSTQKLKGVNTSFIERTLSHGLSSYRLSYSKNGATEYLKGKASPKGSAAKILSFGLGAAVVYTKVSDQIDTTKFIAARLSNLPIVIVEDTVQTVVAVVDKKDSIIPVPVENKIAELSRQKETRLSQLVNTITTELDSIRLTLHDNGEIDNDTVTVFLNGKIIINQLGLTAKLYETVIPVTRDSVQTIELMANNLGSIPPNTAYLTIWNGKEKHELRVSSDYKVNARIDIRYKPKAITTD